MESILFLLPEPESLHRTWIEPLRQAFAERTPPLFLDPFEIAEDPRLLRHQLREVNPLPQLLLLALSEDASDAPRIAVLTEFVRMCSARLVVLGQKQLDDPSWDPLLAWLESNTGYFAVGGLPSAGTALWAAEVVRLLEGGWYGRYEADRNTLKSVSRVAFGRDATGLDRLGGAR